MTVRQLLSQTDSRELSEWLAFFYIKNQPEEEPQDAKLISAQLKNAMLGAKDAKKARRGKV